MDHENALSRVSVRRITTTLALVSALLTLVGLVTQLVYAAQGGTGPADMYTWTHVFDLDAEAALPAWFSTAMLLLCALLLWLIGSSRAPGDGYARHWKFLAWVFVYISADENATLHETLGFWISHLRESMDVYAWLIPGIAFVIYMVFANWKFLRDLPPATRRGLVVAAVVYVAGAAGMELVEARMDALWGTLSFSLMTVIEESLEMAGLVIMIHTLLSFLRRQPHGTTIAVES